MKLCFLGDANSIHTKKLCYFFKDKGYEVSVISLNDGIIDGVKVYSMSEEVDSSSKTLSKIKYLKNIFKMRKLVREINPDILHAHYASSYGLLGSIINYKPYLISLWGSDIYDFPRKSFIHKGIIKYNLKKCNMILSTSKAMANEASLYTNKKIYITPFGVDIDKFSPNGEKIKKENITIGTIKTLEDIYGIDILIKAFDIVNKKIDKDIILKIAGKGSREKYLKDLCVKLNIADKVEFLGYINQDKVVEEFRSFDIAVFPSLFESFGVAAVEAQACGTPVIVSNIDGLMEATLPNKSSLVFNKGDYKDLANRIIYLIENYNIRSDMGKNARKYVLEKYNIKNNFEFIDSLYKNIINS